MQVNSINSQSFNGRFDAKTMEKFARTLSPQDYKTAEKFRIGNRNLRISIQNNLLDPERMPNGTTIIPKQTIAVFKNIKKTNSPEVRMVLSPGELPFNLDTMKLINQNLVKKAEAIISRFK